MPHADRPALFELSPQDNLAVLPWRQAEHHPDHEMFMSFIDGDWRVQTSREHRDLVLGVARGLIAMGIRPGDRVAIMAGTRYEWVVVDSATWAVGGISVPIYPSSSPDQVEWILQDSGAGVVVVENDAMRHTVPADTAATVLVMDNDALATLVERGAPVDPGDVEDRAFAVPLDAPASIVYTSGTTGRPKGCVLTHRNLAAEVQALLAQPIGTAARSGNRTLMFLPLAHVLARAVTYAAATGNATVGFWQDTSTLTDGLASFRPHLVLGVPRVFEKVHDGAERTARHGGRLRARLFQRAEQVAVAHSRSDGHPSLRLHLEHAVFDRLVYRRIRQALGGRCEYAISGGGALRADLVHFFIGLGVPVYEGYGLTETCAAIAVNEPGNVRVGTVGRPVNGNAVRICAGGEVQLRGQVVFERYWNHPDATADAFDDGWFRSGDLGSLDDDGYLTITGRSKEIIVTAGGKNVVPGPMEDVIAANPTVGHAMVVGEGRPYVAALITLDPDGARAWARDRGLPDADPAALVDDASLRAAVQASVDEATGAVSRAEGVRRFVLLAQDFTEEAGELTATGKVKRHVVSQRYADRIDALYRDLR